MYTVMVTGGLGSGKSTLCDMLCAKGAVSIDLDEISRTLLASNEEYVHELAERFGKGILNEEGSVVSAELAARAFADEASQRDLNAIAFPYITELATEYVLDVHCTPRSHARVLVVEVPLLTEVPEFARLADEIIAVNVPSEMRLARAIARGMDAADALKRISVQASDAQRSALADTICDNTGSREQLQGWVDSWWERTMDKLDEHDAQTMGES